MSSRWTIAVVGVAFAAVIVQVAATARPAVPEGAVRIDVGAAPVGRAIPAGFIGLSLEYRSAPYYFGPGPRALNPAFIRLVRYLDPVGSPLIRIGGDTTDWTWWPVAGMPKPGGIRYTLTPHWLALTRAMALALGA